MSMADDPKLTDEERAAHEETLDANLEAVLGEGWQDDEGPGLEEPTEGAEGESELGEEDLAEDPEQAADGAAGDDKGGDDEQATTFTEDDYATAWQALRRDGWTADEIKTLDRDAMIRRGIARDANQRTVDGKLAEAGRLRSLVGAEQEESNEGRRESDDSADAEFGDSQTAGTDLASLAGPVAEAFEEGDTEKGAKLLTELVQKAAQSAQPRGASDQTLQIVLADRAERRLEGRYEGDIAALMADAEQLGATGRHQDKKGLARFDALLDDALRLSGKEVELQDISTSRAAKRRGSKAPLSGNRAPKKPRSEQELLDARIARIMNGERDAGKLRAMR